MGTGPQISLARPIPADIDRFLAVQRALPLSYTRPAGGVLAPPPGFVVDARRVRVGTGDADFAAAAAVLRRWRMFDPRTVEIVPATTPIEVGRTVAVLVPVGPTWWLNATRIVEVLGDEGGVRRAGFSYGTLPGHGERGEERFLVEQHLDGSVWYDLRAFSQPAGWLVRLGNPLGRLLQRRAGEGSMRVVQQTVREANRW